MTRASLLLTWLAASALPAPALAARELTGDWGGVRGDLEARGVQPHLLYVADLVGTLDGGLERAVDGVGLLTFGVDLDGASLVGWDGATLRLRGQWTHGGRPSLDAIGDDQVVDNIEAPAALTIIEGWLQQRLGPASVRAGLLALDTRFALTPVSALFVHSSPGTVGVFGNSGPNGPSIYPVSSLGAQLDLQVGERWAVGAAAVDAVPGDPTDLDRFDPSWDPDDGALLVAEIAYQADEDSRGRRAVLGAYGFTNADRGPIGSYLLLQDVLRHGEDGGPRIEAFAQLDVADDRRTLFGLYLGGGLVARGLVAERPDDEVGVSVIAARYGDRARADRGPALRPWEIVWELTYAVHLLEGLRLQPDLQYIVAPGGGVRAEDAWVGILRGSVSL